MTGSGKTPESRSVKGSALLAYFKIIRANPDLPWSDHLSPADLAQLDQMILPSSWYPADMFERMGEAIFKLVSRGSWEVVHAFGRMTAEKMAKENPGLVVPGQPRDTVHKYLVIMSRLYSFKLLEKQSEGPGQIEIAVYPQPVETSVRLFAAVTAGTVERLIELAGGRGVRIRSDEPGAHGGPGRLEIQWEESAG